MLWCSFFFFISLDPGGGCCASPALDFVLFGRGALRDLSCCRPFGIGAVLVVRCCRSWIRFSRSTFNPGFAPASADLSRGSILLSPGLFLLLVCSVGRGSLRRYPDSFGHPRTCFSRRYILPVRLSRVICSSCTGSADAFICTEWFVVFASRPICLQLVTSVKVSFVSFDLPDWWDLLWVEVGLFWSRRI
jgi:hypothetical protein